MNTENYLIIGGTGKTGRRIVDRLNQLGQNVILEVLTVHL